MYKYQTKIHFVVENARLEKAIELNFIMLSSITDGFIVLTETWLSTDIIDTELGLFNYNIFGLDRNIQTNNSTRGGGVMVCISGKYISSRITVECDYVEHIFVEVKLSHSNTIIIGACYIPPNSPVNRYSGYTNTAEQILSTPKFFNAKCIFLGDFNLPKSIFNNKKIRSYYLMVYIMNKPISFLIAFL